MAFAFFRKRQKMVLIIMAALMVVFLIGYRGLDAIFRRGSGEEIPVARTRYGELGLGERRGAQTDLELLRRLRPGHPAYFFLITSNGDQAGLAYALLLQEARSKGVHVTTGEVNRYLEARELTGQQYQAFLSQLRQQFRGASDSLVRSVITRWLMIRKYFVSQIVAVPPSETQLRHLYRDLNEQIDLRLVPVDAERFVDDMETPSSVEIVEQFNTYRDRIAGQYTADDPFGFGYRYPDRVRLEYLFVDQRVVERAIRPSDQQVMDYYIAHRDEFTKQVPVVTTQPAGEDGYAIQPTTSQTQAVYRTEPMSFTEAREQVFTRLQQDLVASAMRDLTDQAEQLAEQTPLPPARQVGYYEPLAEKLLLPAEGALARKINVDIRSQPLEQAVAALSAAAGVPICYPWGEHGERQLDPSLRVSVEGRDITLAEALAKIGRQIRDWPELQWVRCPHLDGALFPSGGVPLLPVRVEQTDLLTPGELQADPILGAASTARDGGRRLLMLAFEARAFGENGGGMEQGQEGPRMFVSGRRPGRLLWRLLEARPSKAEAAVSTPDQIDPERVEKVREDLLTRRAFEQARRLAEKVLEQAQDSGLAKAAEQFDLTTSETGLFARKVQISPRQQLLSFAQMTGRLTIDLYIRSMLMRPQMFRWSDVPTLMLPGGWASEQFMVEAFALAPKDVEPPYPDEPGPMAVIDSPAIRKVLVVQRIGYRPAVESEYTGAGEQGPSGRERLVSALRQIREWEAMSIWFDLDQIKQRVDYQPVGGPAPQTQPASASTEPEELPEVPSAESEPVGSP